MTLEQYVGVGLIFSPMIVVYLAAKYEDKFQWAERTWGLLLWGAFLVPLYLLCLALISGGIKW